MVLLFFLCLRCGQGKRQYKNALAEQNKASDRSELANEERLRARTNPRVRIPA